MTQDPVRGERDLRLRAVAHEAGHSIQDKVGYAPLVLRTHLVPVVSIGSRLWFLPFLIGALLAGAHSALGPTLMNVGIVLFASTVLFQLVTLPTEFNASNRAKAVLNQSRAVPVS